MYRDKPFRIRSITKLRAEIAWAKEAVPWTQKVFLADGDALVAKASLLAEVCDALNEAFPNLRRISIYASPQSLALRTVEEMSLLKEKGLTLCYLGIESG
ncbi:MAG: radical SAM protein, partial [Planctomycetota bacterium]|nr:radical SAM protein [Planctomycetota bacterium]